MSEPTSTTTPNPTPQGGETPPTANPVQLPDDHPLVKTLAAQKEAIKELRGKAQRLDEIEEANKSEIEKAQDRAAKAEAKAAEVPTLVTQALREHLVALHEIDKDDAELFLTANEPELLLKQVTRLMGQADKRKKQNNVSPREGKTPSTTTDPRRAWLRENVASGG